MQSVDLYCERLGPGLFAEPLNALSNVAFLVGAILLWRNRTAHLPAVLLASVGLGSALFHIWATPIGMALDVVPIVLLIAWAGREALVQHLGWSVSRIGGVALGLILGALPLWFWVSDPAAAGIAYLPAGVLLWGVWTRFHAQGHPGAVGLLVASIAFTLAYTVRALDGVLCEWVPMGTHWIWHLLNALSMSALIWALRSRPPLSPPPRSA